MPCCDEVVLILLIISGIYIGAWPRVLRSLNDRPIISEPPPVRLLRLPRPDPTNITGPCYNCKAVSPTVIGCMSGSAYHN